MGIEWAVPILGVEGLGNARFPWRRRPEGALRSGDGQMGDGGAVIRRTKTTAWWAFVGHMAKKPTGLAKRYTSSENEIPFTKKRNSFFFFKQHTITHPGCHPSRD
jgi:hypothetical protein